MLLIDKGGVKMDNTSKEIELEIKRVVKEYKEAKEVKDKRLQERSIKKLKNILEPFGISYRRFI